MIPKHVSKRAVTLSEPRLDGLTAEAWSYAAEKSQEVFVRILRDGKHVVTARVRVPK